MVGLFAGTLFLSATLMFVVEPMIGKLILPLLGGAPAVWTTCVMFFQFELLVGYLYAHVSANRLTLRRQVTVHLALLALGAATLPLALHGPVAGASERPILTVLWLLTRSVGLPLLGIAATAPLLQGWFSTTKASSADDPFFLYAASNFGSLVALLAYPFLIEPMLGLHMQRSVWSVGYAGLLAMTAACAWPATRAATLPGDSAHTSAADDGRPVDGWQRFRWFALAAVPSSLMLGATTFISTDVAAVPLLWVVPLALYLLTYVLAFARRQLLSLVWMNRLLPVALAAAVYSVVVETGVPISAAILVHLAALFIAAFVCHAQLANVRPSSRHLTDFYLWISVGGLVGGMFNTLVAPVAFTRALEYPIALLLAALLRPRPAGVAASPLWRELCVATLPLGAALLMFRMPVWLHGALISAGANQRTWVTAAPLIVCVALASRPARFAYALAAVSVALLFHTGTGEQVLHAERSFFGTHRVFQRDGQRILMHGTTKHGAQSIRPELACVPLTYYAHTGPAGQLFASFTGPFAKRTVASIGLGTASLAPYARPGQQWTFFEINPAVERIAQDPRYFTFLHDCMQGRYRIVTGDARLAIELEPDGRFDVMVFDAFSSDAIPLHLATREALSLYLRKLAPGGVLAFHVSNRNLNLEPAFGNLARDLGLAAVIFHDYALSAREMSEGKTTSAWMAVARRREDLGSLLADFRWTVVPTSTEAVWTDDYSNIVSALEGLPLPAFLVSLLGDSASARPIPAELKRPEK